MQCGWCRGSVLINVDKELYCISCGRLACPKCGGVFIPRAGHLTCLTCGELYGYGQEMTRGGTGGSRELYKIRHLISV